MNLYFESFLKKMKKIQIRTKPEYEVVIEEGLLKEIPQIIKKEFFFGKYAIITDETVRTLYGNTLKEEMLKQGLKAEIFSFASGEKSKNMKTILRLAQEMVEKGFDRGDCVIALGGGVPGDMAGFLASIYKRGIPFIQIPTTLLAQVDSSVGGKTGVDLPQGKNLLGTFYQPVKVYIDPQTLKTLPEKEFKNGLAEVIKYGCIKKRSFFYFLKKKTENILNLEIESIEEIIFQSVRIKAEIVSKDEKEKGLRMLLNFGHTVGHAIEAACRYRVPHGFAVASGMVYEALLSEKLGIAKEKVSEKIKEILINFNMPYDLQTLASFFPGLKKLEKQLSPESLTEFISHDKKVIKGKLHIVCLEKIGKAIISDKVSPSTLLQVF